MDKLTSTDVGPLTENKEEVSNRTHIFIKRIDIDRPYGEGESEIDTPASYINKGIKSSQRSINKDQEPGGPKEQAKTLAGSNFKFKDRSSKKFGKSIIFSNFSTAASGAIDPTSILATFVSNSKIGAYL